MTLSIEQKQLLPKRLHQLTTALIDKSKSRHQLLTLSEMRADVLRIIDQVTQTLSTQRVGYVSGVISGEGDHKIAENIALLGQWTERVRTSHDFPIFGPPDLFDQEVYEVLEELELERSVREPLFNDFWRSIITEKVTDIFMTPNWQAGKGTWLELKTAQEKGIQVHYL